jgi:hypothetical protein
MCALTCCGMVSHAPSLKIGGLSPEAGGTIAPEGPKPHALWKTPPEPVLRSATPLCMETATRTKASRNRGQYGLLNRQEAAAALGISVKSLDALTQSGRLRAIHMTDRLVRYWPQDLDAFVKGRSERED